MKFSAASPQYSFNHGIFASKPPAATTIVLASMARAAPSRMANAEMNSPSRTFSSSHFGFVKNLDAELGRRVVVGVHHRLAAAEHEQIAARQMERAAQRLLPAHAVGRHPIAKRFRFANHQSGQPLVGRAAGDAAQILPKLLFAVSIGDEFGGRPVHITNIAGVAAVAAAKISRRAFEHNHPGPGAPRRDRRAQRRIAAAGNKHVIRMIKASIE